MRPSYVLMTLALVGLFISFAGIGCRNVSSMNAAADVQDRTPAPDFAATLEWLNTDKPISLRDLRGKVVILDFWTYCCINCMHIIPDLKKLEAKYPSELVVIGVHSAKFQNEKDANNIREAILRYELEHPVVNDRDFLVWNAYGVNSWPTLVLIDPEGKIVGGKSGEGVYDVFDRVIAAVIKEFEPKGTLNRKPIRFALEKDKKHRSVLSYPGKIAADEKSGRLFFTDSNHNRIIITSLSGAIQEVIGDGEIGLKDGDLATARFFRPQGITYDAGRNSLYVADTENHAIRKLDLKARSVTTLAGSGKQAGFPPVGGSGTGAELSSPWDLALVGDTLYVAMAGTHQLWSLNLKTLRAEPYAGGAGENIVDGPLATALLAQPSGLTTDGKKLYFADSEVSAVRTADLGGKGYVRTLIGKGLFDFGDVDGRYPKARLQHPIGIAYRDGFVYVADTYNHKIRRLDPQTRDLQTLVGTGKRGMQDGPAKQASLNEPNGLAFAAGKMYIADTNNHMIRVYDPSTKTLSTLRLSSLEKVARKASPASAAGDQKLPPQDVSAGARTLSIEIRLPKGTKFNKGAPFAIKATSDKPDSVEVGAFNITSPAPALSIPITAKSGEATLTVEMNLNYCAEGNEGLCYFKDKRFVIPVRVTPSGAGSVQVVFSP